MELQSYKFGSDITRVEVGAISAKTVFEPAEGDDIIVEYSNSADKPEFTAALTGKSLVLKEKLSLCLFGQKRVEDSTITVKLPQRKFSEIKISTASGGADISGITAQSFILHTASGEVNISAYFDNIKVQSASGNITIENPTRQEAHTLSVCTVSGSAAVRGCSAKNFSLHSVSGKTSYEGASGAGVVSVTSGNVDITYADWNNDLKLSVISGSVNISLPQDSGMALEFSGVSGALKTDLGNEKGDFMSLAKGTQGGFGGENRHKLSLSLTSGNVTVMQQ